MPEALTGRPARESGYHIPAPLKEYDFWVVWVPEWDKTARAPWQTGHMYRCEWAESKDVDPRRPFEKAKMVADLPVERVDETWSFPSDKELPEAVEPAVLLPREYEQDPIAFVDFDDVRDPDTGVVPEVVWSLIERLGGFVEISRSGEGLHCWVKGELPDGLGKFIQDLDGPGQIEMYDHARMTGGTWRHVEGTPRDAIPEAQDVLEAIINEYGDTDDERQMATANTRPASRAGTPSPSSGARSPYFDLPVEQVADKGAFRRYRDAAENPAADPWQGPHPAHGGTSSSDAKSTNFNVDGDVWHCFAHGTGGGALQLVAVLDGVCNCRDCGSGDRQGAIYRDRQKLLRACLHARERFPRLQDEKPPYEALVAVAELADLQVEDAEASRLGSDAYRLSKQVYDGLSPGDV